MRIHPNHPRQGVSNKGTSQSREDLPDSISQQYSPRTSTKRPTGHQPNHNHNNYNKNETNNTMNNLRQIAHLFVDTFVTTKNNATPRTATTTIDKEHTIIFTNSNKTSLGQSQGRARKTS